MRINKLDLMDPIPEYAEKIKAAHDVDVVAAFEDGDFSKLRQIPTLYKDVQKAMCVEPEIIVLMKVLKHYMVTPIEDTLSNDVVRNTYLKNLESVR